MPGTVLKATVLVLQYPELVALHKKFAEVPNVKAYLESDLRLAK